MIVTIYYLIPGLRDLISFPLFLGGSGILLVGGGWVLGKVLVKRFRIQPMENYISSEVNPFTNAALTAKERVYWNAMVVLLKKEMVTAKRFESITITRDTTGTLEAMPHWAGESVTSVEKVQPAAAIMDELVSEAEKPLHSWK